MAAHSTIDLSRHQERLRNDPGNRQVEVREHKTGQLQPPL